MNGEMSVLIDERDGVLAVPNDAIKNPREAVATGAMLGLGADTIQADCAAQGFKPAAVAAGSAAAAVVAVVAAATAAAAAVVAAARRGRRW